MNGIRFFVFLLALVTCAQADASPFGLKFLHKGPQSGTASWFSATTYDTSIGNGVDSTGHAALPLHAGDHRYYVNSSTGSDSNNCTAAQSASTPKATPGSALACTTDGHGDQILVAEGTTYGAFPDLSGRVGGFSLLYPFAVQSYDPTDPTNEAKHGTANGTGSHARPIFSSAFHINYGNPAYLAVRGLDLNPGNVPSVNGVDTAGSGILLENNLFRYSQTELQINDNPAGTALHWVVRGNAMYGEQPAAAAGLYLSGGQATIEDNVFYHNGWVIGSTRDDATNGANIFNHGSCYCQHSSKVTFRRNLVADGSADGGSIRDDAIAQLNLFLANPIVMGVGGGNRPDLANPFGDSVEFSFNGILSGNDVNTANPRGWGTTSENGKPISMARYNVFAHNTGTGVKFALGVVVNSNTPSYITYDHNVSYSWNGSGSSTNTQGSFTAQAFPTYTNNIWDDPASGSNTNIGTHSFPNSALDKDSLATGAGYASYAAMMQYAIDHPEAHIQRALLSTIMSAYGITGPPALIDLGLGTNTWRTGNKDTGAILNVQDGDTLSFGGTWPTGFSTDANARFWYLDGTASSATSGTGTITETRPSDGATRTTNITWSLPKAPILTSASVTVTSSTTATLHVTTDVGDGTLTWLAADSDPNQTEETLPRYPGEVLGDSDFNNINFHPGWVHHGSQTVTATGVQTILVTGLTSGKDYYFSAVHVSGGGTWSATVDGRYTIGPIHFVQP